VTFIGHFKVTILLDVELSKTMKICLKLTTEQSQATEMEIQGQGDFLFYVEYLENGAVYVHSYVRLSQYLLIINKEINVLKFIAIVTGQRFVSQFAESAGKELLLLSTI